MQNSYVRVSYEIHQHLSPMNIDDWFHSSPYENKYQSAAQVKVKMIDNKWQMCIQNKSHLFLVYQKYIVNL